MNKRNSKSITFEVFKSPKMFEGCKTVKESLHEALCKLIHEDDDKAIQWLYRNIKDIRMSNH